MSVSALLETSGGPLITEMVSIENISNHGARVITHRHWQPHNHVVLIELIGDFQPDAEVVYCQHLSNDRRAVGLRFASAAIESPVTGLR